MNFWTAIARLLIIAIFTQSIFAGLYLSGERWAQDAHRINAYLLVAGVPVITLLALINFPAHPVRKRVLGLMAALAVLLVVQMAVGMMSANGERLLWIHIPLGVALVGLAGQLRVVSSTLSTPPVAQATETA